MLLNMLHNSKIFGVISHYSPASRLQDKSTIQDVSTPSLEKFTNFKLQIRLKFFFVTTKLFATSLYTVRAEMTENVPPSH